MNVFAEDEQIREEGGHPRLLPEEDVERQMYELTEAFLHTKGYERYEISNYAKPGYECRHNCGYWTRKDYLGLDWRIFISGTSKVSEHVESEGIFGTGIHFSRSDLFESEGNG